MEAETSRIALPAFSTWLLLFSHIFLYVIFYIILEIIVSSVFICIAFLKVSKSNLFIVNFNFASIPLQPVTENSPTIYCEQPTVDNCYDDYIRLTSVFPLFISLT